MSTSAVYRVLTGSIGIAACTLAAACSHKTANEETSAGALDTAALGTSASTPAVGPAIQVTRTDGKSVARAMKYPVTADNFARFLAAADSIVALEGRDSTVRAYLGNNLTDAGSRDADAGLRWLEANGGVNDAINSAGISVPDYFVEGIAIAAAQRFMSDPKAAPPTPTLSGNAEFLRSHTGDLEKLRAEREGRPVVVSHP